MKLLVCVIVTLSLVIVGVNVAQLFQSADRSAALIACKRHMSRLSSGLLQYASDFDGNLPPAHRWAESVNVAMYLPSLAGKEVFHCPDAKGNNGYAMNTAVGGANLDSLDSRKAVLLFETDSRLFNASGTESDLARPRHGMLYISLCDGTVRHVSPSAKQEWMWSMAKASKN